MTFASIDLHVERPDATIKLGNHVDWGKWGANTNGRVLALQTPWVTIVVSQADQGRQSEKYSKIQGKEGKKGTHP